MSGRRTRVKICGLTRPADAALAASLGADAVGMVFVPGSPRRVGVRSARAIAREAGGFIHRIGLFLDPQIEEVTAVLEAVPLDMLQFHGRESEAFCRRFDRPYLKAVSAREPLEGLSLRFGSALALVIDSHSSGGLGGTGRAFDWDLFPGDSDRRLILAGGLNPANVAAAVTATRPYAVDVSSGVESAPGIKDPDRMRAFFEQVRRADFG